MCWEDLNSDGESMFTAMLTNSCTASGDGLRVIERVFKVHKQVTQVLTARGAIYERLCALPVFSRVMTPRWCHQEVKAPFLSPPPWQLLLKGRRSILTRGSISATKPPALHCTPRVGL